MVGPESNPSFVVRWRSAVAAGSPVVGGGAIWASNTDFGGTTLYGLDPATGATIATLATGKLDHFNTPTVAANHLLSATTNHVRAYVGPTP